LELVEMPEKEKKTKTASVHDIPAEEYKKYQHDAIDRGFRSVSQFLHYLIREGKKRLEEAKAWMPPSNLDLRDAVTLVEGGVPDRTLIENTVQEFEKKFNLADYDSVLEYQKELLAWKENHHGLRRHHDLFVDVLDEKLDWVEHKLDELKN
jgi:hypothetical protein